MRTVLKNNDEVAHYWANSVQSEGRTPTGNLYFVGPRIYSYGNHYLAAQIHNNESTGCKPVVLINQHRYSSSTGRHLNHIWYASSHMTQYYVLDPSDPIASQGDMLDTIYDLFVSLLESKNYRTEINILQAIDSKLKTYRNYCKSFNLDATTPFDIGTENHALLNDFYYLANLKRLKANSPEQLRKREIAQIKRHAAKIAKQRAENLQRIEDFKAFKINRIGGLDYQIIRLNYKTQLLETSGGASVPLVEALNLAKRVEAGENVVGTIIGVYKVDYHGTKLIKIGCHTIEIEDALKTINRLKLVKGA